MRHAVSRDRHRSVVALLALCATAAFAAPRVEESADALVIANAHFTITIDKAEGGGASDIATAAGQPITGAHSIYTDYGIYPERVYVGSSDAPAEVTIRTDGDRVIARAEGALCHRDGAPPDDPGLIAYWIEYAIGDDPTIRISWGATPEFSVPEPGAFFSYIFGVRGCIGVFANTDEGILLQDIADHSTRTYQSAEEPLNPDQPWLGFMRRDGSVIAFTDLQSTVGFGNVFFHEDGKGGAAVFFAWLCGIGPDIEAGEEWRASFTLRLAPSFEAFRAGR